MTSTLEKVKYFVPHLIFTGDKGDWTKLQAQTNPTFSTTHFGPELTLGKKLSEHFGQVSFLFYLIFHRPEVSLCFAKMAMGSTSLAKNWTPANTTQNESNWKVQGYYPQFVEFLRVSLGMCKFLAVNQLDELKEQFPQGNIKLSGIFWMQGESDSGAAGTANAYANNLELFVKTLREGVR